MSTHHYRVERYQPVMSDVEQTTLLGFLAGYRGYTRDAYTLDLRQFTRGAGSATTACSRSAASTSSASPAISKTAARRGRRSPAGCARSSGSTATPRRKASSSTPRRCTSVDRRIDYESHVAHLDRNELGAILVTAGLSSPRDHALVSLLALNGLRVSEAIGANIEALGSERGHRTLTVLRKGGKLVTMPLAPRVARAIDLAVGERLEGPIFLDADGQRLDRHAAGRIVRRVARRAGIGKRVGPHTLRHAFITAALDAGVPLRDVQEAASHADPRTTMRYDRGRQSLDRHATYIVATFIAGAAR